MTKHTPATRTSAQRYNARMEKIFAEARRLKYEKAYPKLVEALLAAAGALHLVEAHGAAEHARTLLRELGESE